MFKSYLCKIEFTRRPSIPQIPVCIMHANAEQTEQREPFGSHENRIVGISAFAPHYSKWNKSSSLCCIDRLQNRMKICVSVARMAAIKSKTNGRGHQRKTIETRNDFYVTSLFMFILCASARALCAELQFDRIIMMRRMHINRDWKSMSHILRKDCMHKRRQIEPRNEKETSRACRRRKMHSKSISIFQLPVNMSETLECAQIVFYCHKSVGDCCFFA